MKFVNIICLMLVFAISIQAQTTKNKRTTIHTPNFKSTTHGVGVFGNSLIYLGGVYSFEKAFVDSKNERGWLKLGRYTVNGSANVATFWHYGSHVAFVNYYELNYRQYIGKRLGLQLGFGPGIHVNVRGESYTYKNDKVKKSLVSAKAYFAPEISSALILGNSRNNKLYSLKSSIFFLLGYNGFVLPALNWEFKYQF